MDLTSLFAGIGGGLRGGVQEWDDQQAAAEKRREFNATTATNEDKLQMQQRLQQMKDDIQQQLGQLRADAKANDTQSVDTVDDQGNPVTKFVPKGDLSGKSFPKFNKPAPDDRTVERVETVDEAGKHVTKFVPRSDAVGTTFQAWDPPKVDNGEPLERVDTVDDQGKPIIKFVTRKDAANTTWRGREAKDPNADDPTLPNGVRSYLAGLPSQFSDRAAAEANVKAALPSLMQAHPKLDVNKVYRELDATFGKRVNPDQQAIHDALSGGGGPTAPSASPFDAIGLRLPSASAPSRATGPSPAAPAPFPGLRMGPAKPPAEQLGLRVPSSAAPAPGPSAAPAVGTRRTIRGQLAEWDGRGWKPVRQ